MTSLLPFNLQWYLSNNPDIADAVSKGLVDAFEHFETHGKAEGRSSTPLFNSQEYLLKNPDVAAAIERGETTAYDHFINFGASESRSPLNLFDQAFYLLQNPDVATAVAAGTTTAVQHFLMHGQSEPRPFNPSIDLGAYLQANPDIAGAVQGGFMSAMGHLMQFGAGEGRDLGNGVNLADFANDPAYADAIASGNFEAALDRVGDVAPFLPTFVTPTGWTPPADTPIPLDFVPLEGKTLVIPEGVIVPEGTTLPDTFTPPDPVVPPGPPPVTPPGGDAGSYENAYADLSAHTEGKFLYAGTTNPANGFVVSTNQTAKLELGLDIRYSQDAVEVGHSSGLPQNFVVDASRGEDLRFAYSVATTDGSPLNLDAYTYTLSIDRDAGPGQDWIDFKLTADAAATGESPYQWVHTATDSPLDPITDDGGNAAVSQNIQAFHWWKDGDAAPKFGDKYDLKLQAHLKDGGALVADSSLTVDLGVVPSVTSYGDLVIGQQQGFLYAGSSNPANGFALSNTHELELGLDVRTVGIGTEIPSDEVSNGAQVFNVLAGNTARFAYSVASKDGAINLTKYDFKLKIDTNGTEAADFLTFKMAKQQSEGQSKSSYEWVEEGTAVGRVIADDGGTTEVTQNIQAVGWYLGTDPHNTALEPGQSYAVQLSAYLAGTEHQVAHTEIIMLVGSIHG